MLPKNRSHLLIQLAIICLFCFQVFFAYAQSSQAHTVKKGDNLYQLAKRYHVTVDQIKKANNLKSINLSLGQKLKIPGSAASKEPASETKKKTSKKKSKSENEKTLQGSTRTKGKTSFPDFNRMGDKSKPGLAEGVLQKTKEILGEKPPTEETETPEETSQATVSTNPDITPIPKEGYHIVKYKETLFRISKTYGIEIKDLMKLNKMKNYSLKRGQRVKLVSDEQLKKIQEDYKQQRAEEALAKRNNDENRVQEKITVQNDTLDLDFSLHVVQRHETLSSISRKYNIPVEQLKRTNNLTSNKIFPGQKIYLKVLGKKQAEPEIVATPPKEIPELKDPSRVRNDLGKPVNGGHIMSNFGLRSSRPHKGLDIGAPSGTPIYAVLDGKVVYSGMQSGYGNVIVLEHPDFVMTVYAHNERNIVNVGDNVQKGQQIAVVGQTGNATAPHLHFEYRVKGKAIDPKKVLPDL